MSLEVRARTATVRYIIEGEPKAASCKDVLVFSNLCLHGSTLDRELSTASVERFISGSGAVAAVNHEICAVKEGCEVRRHVDVKSRHLLCVCDATYWVARTYLIKKIVDVSAVWVTLSLVREVLVQHCSRH